MEKHRKRPKTRSARLPDFVESQLSDWLDRSGMTYQQFAEFATLTYIQQNPNPQYLREQDYEN